MEVPAQYCVPFHESANRPHLLLGCEPALLGADCIGSVLIPFSVPKWWGILLGIVVFLFTREILRQMAKEDPIMATVHMEAQRYRKGFWTANPMFKG